MPFRMMYSKIASALVFVMIVAQLTGSAGFLRHASAAEISNNIITDATLTILDASGTPVTDAVYEQGAKVNLDFKWELPNGHGYKADDTFSFDIPESFKLYTDFTADLVLEDGGKVGQFTVDASEHRIVMTFNDYIENYDNVKGTMQLKAEFDKQIIKGNVEQEIVIKIKDFERKFVLLFKPDTTTVIEKKGTPDGYNPKSITWSIDVNKVMKTVENAIVTDPIPDGLSLADATGVEVYKLSSQLDGSVTEGAKVVAGEYTALVEEGVLKVSFKNAIASAYRVKFTTPIADAAKASFSNTAAFSGDNQESRSATATVTPSYGPSLGKESTGYSAGDQTLSWAIKFNYRGSTIPAGAELTDTIKKTQSYDVGSVAVYPVTFDMAGNPTKGAALDPSAYTVEIDNAGATNNTFKLTFKDSISSAYRIEYNTFANERVEAKDKIANEVTWGTEKAGASRDIGQVVLTKSIAAVDYQNQTVNWKIVVNGDSATMTNAKLTDWFTQGGMKIETGSIAVKSQSGLEDAAVAADLNLDPASKDARLVVTFKPIINEPYIITYTTKYSQDWLAYDWRLASSSTVFPNKAALTWDEKVTSGELSVTTTFTPNNATKGNGYKFGSYNPVDKTIAWTIGANYNRKSLNEAVLEDTLEEGQKLIPGSLELHEMIVPVNGEQAKGASVPAGDYAVEYDETSGKLKVSFKKAITTGYILTFKTSVDGLVLDGSIANAAQLTNGSIVESKNWTATVTIPNGGEYVSKSGAQDGWDLKWTVAINRGQSTVQQATVKDSASAGQIYVTDSFHVYETVIGANGSVSKASGELTEGTDYSIVITAKTGGGEDFELKFLHEIKTAYILEYKTTMITADNGDKVFNDVEFTGENVKVGVTETTKEIIIGLSSGSGTGSGDRGSLTVLKKDEETQVKLSGATFALYRVSGSAKTFVKSLATDADGKAVFRNLLSGSYILIETAAPTGYALDATEHPVTLAAKAALEVAITNKKTVVPPTGPIEGSLTITKTDAADSAVALSGATFELYSVAGPVRTLVATQTTSADGKAKFEKLPLGDYVAVEKAAPAGYELDGTDHPVTIAGVANVDLTVTNKKYTPPGPGPGPIDPGPTNPGTVDPDPTNPGPAEPGTTDPGTTDPGTTDPETTSPGTKPTPKPVDPPVVSETTTQDETIEGQVEVPLGGTAVVSKQPDHGTVKVNPDGTWAYKPDAGFVGKDRISIIVTDPDGNTEEIFIDITVDPIPLGNDDPKGPAKPVATLPKTGEGSHLPIQLAGVALIVVGLALFRTRVSRSRN
ncbi:collagen binding domain-containing protein [Paenibacillus methanolicus]|uniref:LPXTG-motif cell wall-anchored protein n=1 Tax=Paenibacillus methanolicus TaxID=582686 RepID=A0A5S5BSR4_9BACL|nr:collagen binding domain-containing protein [Paenibacillus methanolicus]TYP70047.1 LPXTG-motif cell wall-anchored protein [Paenibacillus methanolicus]